MMEKFTKGPWMAFGMEIRFPDELSGEYISPVASVSRMNRSEHDAALIAAAPEMYEMLKCIRNCVQIPQSYEDRVDAVLAKARGEQ